MSASELLAEVAQARGLRVHRLSSHLVECAGPDRRVLFYGLVGSRSGRPAQVLCARTDWLRARLARAGLPVAPSPADHDLRLMIDAESGAGGHDQRVEAGESSPVLEVAVVAGAVIAARRAVEVPVPEIPAAGALAVRAVAALPDAGYASVRLLETPSGVVVDSVDPTLAGWGSPQDPASRRVVTAILDLEYA